MAKAQVGVILGAHGIRGEVKIRSFTDIPKAIFSLGALSDASGAKKYICLFRGGKDDAMIAAIEGVSDRNAAELLKGAALYADADLLPENSKSRLLGLTAVLANGEPYGKVIAAHNFGAGDILELELPNKKTEMIPFNSNFFGEIDGKKNTIIVIPPEYLEAKS